MKQKQKMQECSAASPTTADSKATPATLMNRECYITLILYLFNIRKRTITKFMSKTSVMHQALAMEADRSLVWYWFDTRDIYQMTCPRNGCALQHKYVMKLFRM